MILLAHYLLLQYSYQLMPQIGFNLVENIDQGKMYTFYHLASKVE